MTTVTIIVLKDTFMGILFEELRCNNGTANKKDLINLVENHYQKLIFVSKSPNEWGNEYHLLALATCLSLKIHIYNFYESNLDKNELIDSFKMNDNKSGFHLLYEPLKDTMFDNIVKNTIYGHYNPIAKHYTSLIPQKNTENDISC